MFARAVLRKYSQRCGGGRKISTLFYLFTTHLELNGFVQTTNKQHHWSLAKSLAWLTPPFSGNTVECNKYWPLWHFSKRTWPRVGSGTDAWNLVRFLTAKLIKLELSPYWMLKKTPLGKVERGHMLAEKCERKWRGGNDSASRCWERALQEKMPPVVRIEPGSLA